MKKQSNIYLIIAIGILALYFLPYLLQWDNSYITIHDNLDSDVVWYKSIAESGHIYSLSNQAKLENIMNGIPRNSLPSGYTFVSFLFLVFAPFTAFIINFFITHIVAFIGMYLLLSTFVFPKKEDSFLYTGISLAFAILPFYGTHPGIAISGIPILLWCFIHLKQTTGAWYHFVIIAIFAFYSSLIYTGIFILFFLYLYILRYWIINKKILPQYVIGLGILTIGLFLSEIQVVSQIFDHSFEPHRLEFAAKGISFLSALKESSYIFIQGQYHAPSAHWIIALLSIIFLKISMGEHKIVGLRKQKFTTEIFIIIVCISLFYGLWQCSGFIALQQKISILKIVQWHRFYWLLPIFWYVLFALIIRSILEYSEKLRKLLYGVVILQILIVLATNKEDMANYYNIILPKLREFSIPKPALAQPTFAQYYDQKLFAEIRDSIKKPQQSYRVASLGINPEIAIFNGFYCLDSYQRNYSLAYKHTFKQIINTEILKDSVLYDYFQNWGSRCYVFSHELGMNYNFRRNSEIMIHDFDLNIDAFKKMGGEFLFSAVEIELKPDSGLTLFGEFERENSYWKIWVYACR